MIDETLIAFFTSTSYAAKNIAAKIGPRAHKGMIPRKQANQYPRLFLERSNKEYDIDIDGGNRGALVTDTFDVELISNKSSDLLVLSDEMWKSVHGYFGSIASTQTVKGIMLENQDDEYEPRGIGNDLGLDVSAFSMRVMYAST
jgi:hypothetical protein